jgi:branched-chain amino acid transport system ATP-binding protein
MQIKGPRKLVEEATGDSAKLPLLVLFLLNMVDELDQVTYGIVAPEIRDTFGVKESTIVAVGSLAAALVIMLVVPVGYRADRHNRVRMVSVAALAWGSMTVLTGLSGFVGAFGLLILARFGAGLGRVMNEPVHVSLLADYYPPVQHGRIYSLHRSANAIGGGLVLLCALLADIVGWRVGFMLLAIPTFIAWTLLTRLHEPVRGASIDQAMALRAEESADKVPLSEAWRRLKGIPSLKRGWWAGLFIGASVVPIAIFLNFFFEQVYNVESITARGAITTLYYLGSLVGLKIGSDQSTKALMAGDLPRLSVMGGITLIGAAGGLLCLALAPWIGVSIFFVFVIGMGTAFNSFGLPMLAAIAPPRLRSQALGYFVFFIGLGALLLSPIVAGIGEEQGYRFGIAILSVLLAVAGLVYASAKPFVRRDAEQAYNTLMLEAGLLSEQAAGRTGALLTCRGV